MGRARQLPRGRGPNQAFDRSLTRRYTLSMKTAISLPDELFSRAEMLADHLKVSRSQLYAQALREYVDRRSQAVLREAYDAVFATEPSELDAGFMAAQMEILEDEGW